MKVKNGHEVEAFTIDDLKKINEYLNNNKKYVILGIFKFGIYTGLKISNYLNSNFEDIQDNYLIINNLEKVQLNIECLEMIEILKNFYKEKGIKDYNKGPIFKSLKFSALKNQKNTPIGYPGVSNAFRDLAKKLNIAYPIGTNSLKKTYKKFINLSETEEIEYIKYQLKKLNPKILKQLNITLEEIDNLHLE
ncbi:MAG: hypothetical protein ACRC8M_03925 [Cetobacterium sp.]|uniref:hypothetical protein n=1 Tax=Cetobacterium sp. TaxID=2071632 RepID=UPI003F40C5E2